eukprot:COSAG04_NODE_1288_length_7365_cov_12.007707_10_plen_74_part_00
MIRSLNPLPAAASQPRPRDKARGRVLRWARERGPFTIGVERAGRQVDAVPAAAADAEVHNSPVAVVLTMGLFW